MKCFLCTITNKKSKLAQNMHPLFHIGRFVVNVISPFYYLILGINLLYSIF